MGAVWGAGLATIAGVATLVAGLGWSIWRWRRPNAFREHAIRDVLHRTEREQVSRLQELRHQLRRDRDPHSTQLVRQLRAILTRLVDSLTTGAVAGERDRPAMDNLATSAQLYESCCRLLERSFELWKGAQQMATDDSRQVLLDQRASLLQQVEQSMSHLESSLDQMQTVELRDDDGSLAANVALQDELQLGLETARRVEERIESLERELQLDRRINSR